MDLQVWSGRVLHLCGLNEVLDEVSKTVTSVSKTKGGDRLMGVMGVSSIFTADCCCDAGVERFELLLHARIPPCFGLDGTLTFVVKIHCLKRLHFFMFSAKVRAKRSRSARRAS